MTLSINEIEESIEKVKRHLLRKANKVEKALMAAEDIILADPAPRPKYIAYVRYDDRGYPIAIQLNKPKDEPMRRKGEWVKMVSEV